MRFHKVCTAVVVMMMLLLSVAGVAPAAAQDWRFSGFNMELSVESDTGAILLAGTKGGIEGYRYTSKSSFYYGKPLNSDGAYYIPVDCRNGYQSPGGDLDYVHFGRMCTLVVGFTNPTEHELDNVTVSYTGDPADRDEVRFLEHQVHNDVGTGEFVEFLIDVTYRNLGRNRDFLTVSGEKISANPAERFSFSDSVAYDYWVEPTAPSVPTGFGYVFTNNTYTLYWNPPINNGGFPITGYRVDLLEVGPLPPGFSGPGDKLTAEQIVATQLACNFAGRPELTVCDLPNNQLQRIEGDKDYVFRVRALTSHLITSEQEPWAPKHHSNIFHVPHTLGLEPRPEPQPTPTPPPEPEPPPPDTLVAVADLQDAPNLISMINAASYSNNADAPVLRLYQAYFNRQPDLNGAKYWLDIRRQGHDLLAIAGYMSDSQEFANNYSGIVDQEYLRRVYDNMLGRTYDQAGFNYWLDLLQGRNDFGLNPSLAQLSRSGVVFYVSGGAEFIANYPYTKS